jgi:hypothetical protein
VRAAILIVVGLSLGLATSGQNRRIRNQNKAPVIKSFISSSSLISFCPFRSSVSSSVCSNTDQRLTLTTTVEDLGSDALIYSYKVSAGKIEGEGAQVIWDLNDAVNGEYTATVSVKNKSGPSTTATLTVTKADCGSCDPPPPPCPAVTVECPGEVEKGKPVTFTANVKGDPIIDPLLGDTSYEWWASSGKIVKGQSEKKMTLEPAGFPFETITVTVSVRGFDPSCTGTQASCTISVKGGR